MRRILSATVATLVVTDAVPKDLRQYVLNAMSRAFGGATVREGVGTYVREDSGLLDYNQVEEIVSFVPPSAFGTARALLEGLAHEILDTTDEESVLWTYNGTAYLQDREQEFVPQLEEVPALAHA